MKLIKLINIFKLIDKTSSYIKKIEILVDILKTNTEPDLYNVFFIIDSNDSLKKKIMVSYKILDKIYLELFKISYFKIKELDEEAFCFEFSTFKNINKTKELTIDHIFNIFKKLSEIKGVRSTLKKIELLKTEIMMLDLVELYWFNKILLRKLRIGVNNQLILYAISAFHKEEIGSIKKIYGNCVNLRQIIKAISTPQTTYFNKPIKVMLAKTVTTNVLIKMINTLNYVYEYKYDGFRAIIHINNGNVIKIQSRRMDDITNSLKPIIEKYFKGSIRKIVIDCEICLEEGSFQDISKIIKRKYFKDLTFKLKIFIFDVLYLDRNIINEKYAVRKGLLKSWFLSISKNNTVLKLVEPKGSINSFEGLKKIFANKNMVKFEGLILKDKNSIYELGIRNNKWIKFKKNNFELDLIVTGALKGSGFNKNRYSSFLVECYDEKDKKYKELGFVGTGFKESDLIFLTAELSKIKISEDNGFIRVKPKFIFEVWFQNLQKSKKYNSGFSLRFPAFKKIRVNKPLNEIDSLEKIKKIYYKKIINY